MCVYRAHPAQPAYPRSVACRACKDDLHDVHAALSAFLCISVTLCRTDVVEFVSTEHTPRNLLIRAVRQQRPLPAAEQAKLAGQYVALKQYWGVTPHLEKLMREDGTLPAALQ
jgi:hypothetical protein